MWNMVRFLLKHLDYYDVVTGVYSGIIYLRKRIILFLLCLVMVGSSYITIRESKVNPLESFEGEIIDIRLVLKAFRIWVDTID